MFSVPGAITDWKSLSGRLEAIDQILDVPLYDNNGKVVCPNKITEITVRNLCFDYDTNIVLKNVNIHFTPGMYCICGASGCGKSTLLHLIARVAPYDDGEIEINTLPLSSIDRDSYWKNIVYVQQNYKVLSDTIRNNILMGEPFDKERFQRVTELLGLRNVIASRKEGIESVIHADELSTGENLRFGIAHAVYTQKQVILLDEVTDALDPATEIEAAELLGLIAGTGKIVISISHRKTIAEKAEKILFMTNGTVQTSTHEELMSNCREYRELWLGEMR